MCDRARRITLHIVANPPALSFCQITVGLESDRPLRATDCRAAGVRASPVRFPRRGQLRESEHSWSAGIPAGAIPGAGPVASVGSAARPRQHTLVLVTTATFCARALVSYVATRCRALAILVADGDRVGSPNPCEYDTNPLSANPRAETRCHICCAVQNATVPRK